MLGGLTLLRASASIKKQTALSEEEEVELAALARDGDRKTSWLTEQFGNGQLEQAWRTWRRSCRGRSGAALPWPSSLAAC